MSNEPHELNDLQIAISVARRLIDSDQILSVREALRLLLRALDAETDTGDDGMCPACDTTPIERCTACGSCRCDRHDNCARPAQRCPAAHDEDPTPCDGPPAVTVLDSSNAGADGCQHHGARLLASLDGGRVYGLPGAPEGSATRVFQAAAGIRPFAWYAENRVR